MQKKASENKPIIIPKSRAKSLIKPKSYQETINLLFKDYWFKSKSKIFFRKQ
jgi:hypothetical protein